MTSQDIKPAATILLLRDAPPDTFGWVGVGLIVVGMVLSSLASLPKPDVRQATN